MSRSNIAKTDAAHAEKEAASREAATLRMRLEHLEPAEAEAKQIRARLEALGS